MHKRVINASRCIPLNELVKSKQRKIILRELGKEYLPKEIIEEMLTNLEQVIKELRGG